MAVIQSTIKTALIAMSDELKEMDDAEASIEVWADKFSKIIMDAIQSADVMAGIPVSTAGSATAQSGTTTSTGSLI
jgi:hypothetical protein